MYVYIYICICWIPPNIPRFVLGKLDIRGVQIIQPSWFHVGIFLGWRVLYICWDMYRDVNYANQYVYIYIHMDVDYRTLFGYRIGYNVGCLTIKLPLFFCFLFF